MAVFHVDVTATVPASSVSFPAEYDPQRSAVASALKTGQKFTGFADETDAGFTALWTYGGSSPGCASIMTYVDLETGSEAGIFQKVSRITHPVAPPATVDASCSPQCRLSGFTVTSCWARLVAMFSTNWVASGTTGASGGNAYKWWHLYFTGFTESAQDRLDIENTTQFNHGFGGGGLSFPTNNTLSTPSGYNAWNGGSGAVTTMVDSHEYWEFIMGFLKINATTVHTHYYRRQLTTTNRTVISPGTYNYHGIEYIGGSNVPEVNRMFVGVNRNRDNTTAADMYIYRPCWELLDADVLSNPYNVLMGS